MDQRSYLNIQNKRIVFLVWFIRLSSPVWWIVDSSIHINDDYTKHLSRILASIFLVNSLFQMSLFLTRMGLYVPNELKVLSVCINSAILIELCYQVETKNPWQQQTSMIVQYVCFKDMEARLPFNQKYILLLIPLYATIRMAVGLYLLANIVIIESLEIAICMIALMIIKYQQREIFENIISTGGPQSPTNILQVDNPMGDMGDSPNFYLSSKNHNFVEIVQSSDGRNRRNTQRLPSVKRLIRGSVGNRQSISQNQLNQPDSLDESVENPQNFYHSLLNAFPHGIAIINDREEVTFSNNYCEKCLLPDLTNLSIKDKILDVILQSQIIMQRDKPSRKTKAGLNSKIFIDIIRTAQLQNNKIDLLAGLLDPSKYSTVLSPSESKSSKFQQNQNSWVSLDITNMNPSVTLQYVAVEKRSKFLKLKIIQCFTKDQYSAENLNYVNQRMEYKPMLLIIIKNVTAKQTLEVLKTEYQFQNSLLQSFSHELRTPLNCSIQLLNVVKELVKDDLILTKYIRSALGSNQLLIYQINDILDFAACECQRFQYKWESVSFYEIVDEVVDIYKDSCEEKQITMVQQIDSSLTHYKITTDPQRIMQVLVNLMNNAIKFTQSQGRIVIKAKILEGVNGRTIKIQVKDDGHGIEIERLRDIQSQLKKKLGMVEKMIDDKKNRPAGLGLTISNKIVSGLADIEDNHLRITSNISKGTKISFFIRHHSVEINQVNFQRTKTLNSDVFQSPQTKLQNSLPKRLTNASYQQRRQIFQSGRTDSLVSMSPHQQAMKDIVIPIMPSLFLERLRDTKSINLVKHLGETPSLQNLEMMQSDIHKLKTCEQCINVLIVDDVPFNQLALKAMLKCFKLDCDQAHDGHEALQMVRRKTNGQHCKAYKLIFMDIEMPGIDGFQTAAEINCILNLYSQLSNMIMCSAYDTVDNLNLARQTGMSDSLTKPVRRNQLERIIKKFLIL